MEFGENADFCAQQLRNDRDGNVIDGPALIAFEPVDIGQVHGRNKNDRRLFKARVLPDDVGQFEPVELRHANVHENHGNIAFQQDLHRLSARIGPNEVFVQFVEYGLVTEQLGRLVIHHQDVNFVVCAQRCPPASRLEAGAFVVFFTYAATF